MATTEIDIIKNQSKELTKDQKLELMDFLLRQLHGTNGTPTRLKFGKYAAAGRPMSTEEDFDVAEWRPTDLDLNGN